MDPPPHGPRSPGSPTAEREPRLPGTSRSWDDADLESAAFREFSEPESSSLRSADVEALASRADAAPVTPRAPVSERLLVLLANALWGLIGPVLWLPVLARELALAVVGLIHGALTGQQSSRSRLRLREASRFVTSRFLRAEGDGPRTRLHRRFRPLRLVLELVWATLVYSVALDALGVISLPWQRAAATGGRWLAALDPRDRLAALPELVRNGLDRAPADLQALRALPPLAWASIGVAVLACGLLGYLLGSRRS